MKVMGIVRLRVRAYFVNDTGVVRLRVRASFANDTGIVRLRVRASFVNDTGVAQDIYGGSTATGTTLHTGVKRLLYYDLYRTVEPH